MTPIIGDELQSNKDKANGYAGLDGNKKIDNTALPDNVVVLKLNLTATTPPTTDDDDLNGYSIGSVWIDTSSDTIYQCVDNSSAAAIWLQNAGIGWKDNIVSLTSSNTGGASAPTFVNWQGGLYAYSFSASIIEELFLCFHIDHDYMKGTDFWPHIHWAPNSTDTGTVRWGFEYTYARGYSTEAFSSPATIYIEQAASGTVNMHQITEVDAGITIPNADTDMIIYVRVFRDATHANDTFTGEAIGLTADIHYLSDHSHSTTRNGPF